MICPAAKIPKPVNATPESTAVNTVPQGRRHTNDAAIINPHAWAVRQYVQKCFNTKACNAMNHKAARPAMNPNTVTNDQPICRAVPEKRRLLPTNNEPTNNTYVTNANRLTGTPFHKDHLLVSTLPQSNTNPPLQPAIFAFVNAE